MYRLQNSPFLRRSAVRMRAVFKLKPDSRMTIISTLPALRALRVSTHFGDSLLPPRILREKKATVLQALQVKMVTSNYPSYSAC